MHAPPIPGRYYEIQSMSGQYASYWNTCLFDFKVRCSLDKRHILKCHPVLYIKIYKFTPKTFNKAVKLCSINLWDHPVTGKYDVADALCTTGPWSESVCQSHLKIMHGFWMFWILDDHVTSTGNYFVSM